MEVYRSALYWLAMLALPLMARSHTQPLYSLITPYIMRVENEETIVVEAHDYTSPIEVTISVSDFPRKTHTLSVQATLRPENGMMASAVIKVPAKDMQQEGRNKQYVYVKAASQLFTLEKVVLLSFHSGYIFIQTDKTIYTPGSTVNYRLFTVGQTLDPQIKTFSVEIVNPDGIVVYKNVKRSTDNSSIIAWNYNIPDIAITGIWKVACRYEHNPQETYATEFEVKEYVLPNFEVTLESSQKFFYIDDNELIIHITAKFLFGEPVQGQAIVLFGVMMGKTKKSITESLSKVPIQNGKGQAKFTREMLQSRYPNLAELVDNSIYVSVTVVTDTGSDMVHAEKSGIHIVRSPYKIGFPKASKYFKPGMPFSFLVSVTNPDGSPASQVPVCSVTPAGANGVSQADGTAQLVVNTPPDLSQLSVTVETAVANLANSRQSSAVWVAEAYQTPGGSRNYLHLSVTAAELRSGDMLLVNFNLQNSNAATQNQIRYFTYLILSKGKVFRAGRQPRHTGQNPVTMSLTIMPDLIPSFRIVAYYKIGYDEIVADSIWVDVKDTCMGTLKVTGASELDNRVQEPRNRMELKVSGDPGAKVGLVAVDKAVYVLNKEFKISQAKIWNAVEKRDIGCTPGGGRDSAGVFADAGLALQTSSGFGTDKQCTPRAQRRRRSPLISTRKAVKAREYQSQFLRKCCQDGMQENPMGYSCDRRSRYILEGRKCIRAFLDCCNDILPDYRLLEATLRELFMNFSSGGGVTITSSGSSYPEYSRHESFDMRRVMSMASATEIGRLEDLQLKEKIEIPDESDPLEDDDDMGEDIVSRTHFAESWFWKMITLPLETDRDGLASQIERHVFLPDSITTWEVLAVSLSRTKGICVADPYEIRVKKNFFIDLRLPYSIVRNEQVAIRAVLYNYSPWELRVLVELVYNDKVCSASSQTRPFQQRLAIQAGTSEAITYVIIPLELGEVEMEVRATVLGVRVSDGVRKKLRVVPEGMRIFKNVKSVLLDPKGLASASGEQLVTIEPMDLSNVVPNTEPVTFISVTGDIVGETIENSIDGANLKHLIRIPSGCGEQNMIGLTPAVIATHYLDNTHQWDRIGLDRRAEAIGFINKGYTQQLAYRKNDNSYAAFTHRPSSTWLTAYVVKVFAMANQLSAIDPQVLCGALKWLILEKQQPNGIFKEDAPVIHGEMAGGYQGSEPEASLTAFVVIAMQEAKSICQDRIPDLEMSMRKAGNYLAERLESLEKSYSIAITTYALSLLGRAGDGTKLISLSTGTHWPHSSKMHSIEATSYGLLALLQLQRFDLAGPIVRWLTEQRFYGGGYGSTQATIMVFQALAQHQLSMSKNKDETLDISIKLPARINSVHWRINYENAMVSRTEQTTATSGFTVSVSGTGKGTLSVMRVYYAPLTEEMAPCNKFDLTVSVQDASDAKKPEGALASVDIKICMQFLGEADATMTIVDISMLTGFAPDTNDLQRLTNQVDKYISKFEMNEALSDRGSLILYLDKVSHTELECLKFKAHQYFEVGLIQPASVAIYEYYTMENRCTKFYHPDKEDGLLSTLCQQNTCRCMEEKCSLIKKFTSRIDSSVRIKAACEPEVDYVYKVHLTEIQQKGMYIYYTMRIVLVIKEGTEQAVQGRTRQFISPVACTETLSMEVSREYLVWGPRSDMWDLHTDMAYLLTSSSWVEPWPSSLECQSSCQDLQEFVQHMLETGCTH